MEAIPRKYGEWGQFDRYCKLVLYQEAAGSSPATPTNF